MSKRTPLYQRSFFPRLNLEALEERTVPAVFNVTNTDDSGPGSLRAALTAAGTGDDSIEFTGAMFLDATPDTITLTTGQITNANSFFVTINGPTAARLTIDGNNAGRHVVFNNFANVKVNDLTFVNGKELAGPGGSILTNGVLTVNRCEFSNNSSKEGGAIYNFSAAQARTELKSSLFANNTSTEEGGAFSMENGSLVSVGVSNSTFSGNKASGGAGGALFAFRSLDISNSTITNNEGFGGGGVVYLLGQGTFTDCTFIDTIIAGNKNTFGGGVDRNDISTTVADPLTVLACIIGQSDGATLGATASFIGTKAAPVDAKIGPLADNGGAFFSHELLTTSPGLDKGSKGFPAGSFDVRGKGFDRVSNSKVDIGSFEVQVAAAGTTITVDLGDLTVTDTSTASSQLTLGVNGANLRFSDPMNPLTAGTGATQIDANTVEVPVASVTKSIAFTLGAGNDVLLVDATNGYPLPVAASFDGGADTNAVSIENGSLGDVTHTLTDATSGTVTPSGKSALTYSNTGQVNLRSGMGRLTLNYPDTNDTVEFFNDNATNTFIQSSGTVQQLVTSPTIALIVNGKGGKNLFTVTSLADNFDAGFILDAGTSPDSTLNLNTELTLGKTGPGTVSLSAGSMILNQGIDTTAGGATASVTLNGTTLVGSFLKVASAAQLIFDGGTSTLANSDAIGDTTAVVINAGATLNLGGGTDTVGKLTLSDGALSNGTLTAAADYDLRNGNVFATLAGSKALVKTTAGTVRLFGANTFTGGTFVNAGTLIVSRGNQDSLAPNSTITVAAGAIFDNADFTHNLPINALSLDLVLNGGTYQISGTGNAHSHLRNVTFNNGGLIESVGPVGNSSGSNIVLNGTLTTTGTSSAGIINLQDGLAIASAADTVFTIADTTGNPTADLTFIGGGALIPTGGGSGGKLIKEGAGTLLLGSNSTIGDATINAGLVVVNSIIPANVALNTGGSIGGNGLLGGTLTVGAGATLAPGNSPGKLTVGGLTMLAGSTLVVELQAPYTEPSDDFDQIVSTGKIDITGATLQLVGGVTAPPTTLPLTVIDNQSGLPITGTFAGLPESSLASVAQFNSVVSYNGANNSFTLTPITPTAPAISSAANVTFVAGQASTFTITATGAPAPTFSATGLPGTLSLDPVTGVISGTPDRFDAGITTVTITASNGVGADATQTFTLTINAIPVISTTTLPSAVSGTAYSAFIAATGFPAATFSATGLPAGLAIDASTGEISGTTTVSGPATVVVTATNSVGAATQTLTLNVTTTAVAPTITTTSLPGGLVGATYTVTITATGAPAPTFAATGLPAGLSINPTTGVISGTPTTSGTTNVTITASNGVGSPAVQSFALVVAAAPVAPTITTTTLPTAAIGIAYTATLAATGAPAPTFTATGLPSGLSLNSTTGVISGTPTAGGTATVVVTATNAAGSVNRTFTLTVATPAAPVLTPTGTQPPTLTTGAPFTFTPFIVTGTPSPTFTATGLPAGVTINPTTGVVSGTPTGSGTFTATVTASNGVGSPATQTFTLNVTPGTVVVIGQSSTNVFGLTDGASVSLYAGTSTTPTSTTQPLGNIAGGVRTASADLTGDGVPDLIVGTGIGTLAQVQVIDGKTNTVAFSINPFPDFTQGVFVAAGDLDGDGKADLIISPDEGGGPRVRIFAGGSFTQLADFFGIDDPNFRGGARVAAGDFDGDGKADLVVAAGFGGGPRVALFNGASVAAGSPVKLVGDFLVFEPGLRNGAYVTAGDVDGDGRADLIAGAGPGGGPRVFALSGADLLNGTLRSVANFFAGDTNNRGGVRVTVKDLDGDSKADIITGSGTGATPGATVYLGRDIVPETLPPVTSSFSSFTSAFDGVFVG
jgi:autotransporter-associated beta strand protein/predicted outer membrane repeat protein